MDLNHKASAAGFSEVLIKAPISLVWQILADLKKWTSWNPVVRKVDVTGATDAGTVFRWKAGSVSIVSKLDELLLPRRMVWSGKTFGINAIHVWEIKEENGDTRVKTEESFEGLIVWAFSRTMRKMLAYSLKQKIGVLKAESDRHAKMAK